MWRLGRADEAVDAYDAALTLVGNDTERRFLEGRRAALDAQRSSSAGEAAKVEA